MIVIPKEAYPLKWPNGVRRTAERKESRFARVTTNGYDKHRVNRTPADGLKLLREELGRMSARNVVISSNLPMRVDGQPYSTATPAPEGDPGVAVYWSLKRGRADVPYCIPCDKYTRIGCNIYAVALSIEAMRAMERYGAVSIEQAFAGFAALPPGAGAGYAAPPIDWRSVFGGEWPDGLDSEEILMLVRGRYRKLAKSAHPDGGGTDAAMVELNAALEAAERELQS